MGSEYVFYEGVNPGLDSTLVIVGGWPLPYLYDSPYFSPVNSVSFSAALLGLDDLRPGPMLGDVLLFWGALLGGWWLSRRGRRRARQP